MTKSTKTKSLRRSKRHFQLLEVMIAVLLLIICAVPALKVFTNVFQEQTRINSAYDRDHLVRLVHAQIVEKMYRNEISLQQVIDGTIQEFRHAELDLTLQRLGYQALYRFHVTYPKPDALAGASSLVSDLYIRLHKKNSQVNRFDPKTSNDKYGFQNEDSLTYDYKYVVYINHEARGTSQPPAEAPEDYGSSSLSSSSSGSSSDSSGGEGGTADE